MPRTVVLMRLSSVALLLLARPAAAVDFDLAIEGVVAYSASHYSAEVAGEETNGHSNGSHVGLRGSINLADLRLFAVAQRGFERFNESVPGAVAGDYEREVFAGVSSPWGTLAFGRQVSSYRQAGRELDPFHDTSVAGFNGAFAAEGASYGLSNLSNGFNDETLAYRSPELHGFSLRGSMFGDVAGGQDDDFGAGVRYDSPRSGFAAGAEYLDSQGGDGVFGVGKGVAFEAVRIYGSWRGQALALGLSLEHVDVGNEADPRKYGLLSASHAIAPKLKLAASFGLLVDVVPNAVANPDGIDGGGLSIGAFYEILPRLTVYAAGRTVRLDSGADSDTIALGAAYDFSWSLPP